ncbi:hypothetical protein [Sphingomonas sp.]|uniref:hypothetical protein n=1 Tax=Sphingomonas sp. TaxID=28214 RepID=UPI002E353B96|nr:hypothetical protein [Sphingomonas sp.]HEX4693233.1 hypothetical protein [Sphingomonas sp.]
MTDMTPAQSRNRFWIINAFRLLGTAGAVFGVILAARADQWPIKLLGGALVLSAIYMAWTIPAALAHRWRTPTQP